MARRSVIGGLLVCAGTAVLVLGLVDPRQMVTAQDPAHGRAGETSRDVKATAPDPQTQRILKAAQGYRSWSTFPEYRDKAVQSKGHGGMWVVSWYNDSAAQGLAAGSFPQGSVIVKENRPHPNARPAALTTMSKRADGWYWIKSTPDGRVFIENGMPVAGDVRGCVGCHSQAAKDMVFSGAGK